MTYFSDKEEGERPCEKEEIGAGAWRGIQALIAARIEDGSFGARYPNACPDGSSPVGADRDAFWKGMQGEIPNFQELPLPAWYDAIEMPRTLDILDMIQFCWRCVGKPIHLGYHGYYKHHHLRFDVDAGRVQFREDVNRIMRRNGILYELQDGGSVERLVPPVLREELVSSYFRTGDLELNRMLESARRKFLEPDMTVRHEALEALWDAWERLKTLGPGPDKKTQTTALLDSTAEHHSPLFREALEREAKELTWIGNNLQIRHSEKDKEQVKRNEHIDYLFHRLFSLIHAVLRMNKEI
ncbi:hypothetical protein AMC83_PA00004 (plasmid) [Rhizobium phaseoli]|uniref:hypothetical protein n=1 Tax=Rhizobium phaseoli TaxID=396 RepID=UPI0007EAF389|nr:hypothetical protein [Rhizobium phaseoli]ANL74231.1 hypothetical protein AMC83_PA00004 [Rhizobium phaseoli]